jgi:hypothetical protein
MSLSRACSFHLHFFLFLINLISESIKIEAPTWLYMILGAFKYLPSIPKIRSRPLATILLINNSHDNFFAQMLLVQIKCITCTRTLKLEKRCRCSTMCHFCNISQVLLLQLCLAQPPPGLEHVKYLAETTWNKLLLYTGCFFVPWARLLKPTNTNPHL